MTVSTVDNQVFPLQKIGKVRFHLFGMGKIPHAQGLFHILVRINRCDSALGGTELLVRQAALLQNIQHFVVGHADGCTVTDHQIFRRYLDSLLTQGCNLVCQMLQVNHHTGSHDIYGSGTQNSGRQQVQNEFSALIHHRMSRIVTALVTDNGMIVGAEQIDHSALSLVSPVDADD